MGCHLAISTKMKNGKGIPCCNVVVIGELPSGDLLEKMEKTGIRYWGMGSTKYH